MSTDAEIHTSLKSLSSEWSSHENRLGVIEAAQEAIRIGESLVKHNGSSAIKRTEKIYHDRVVDISQSRDDTSTDEHEIISNSSYLIDSMSLKKTSKDDNSCVSNAVSEREKEFNSESRDGIQKSKSRISQISSKNSEHSCKSNNEDDSTAASAYASAKETESKMSKSDAKNSTPSKSTSSAVKLGERTKAEHEITDDIEEEESKISRKSSKLSYNSESSGHDTDSYGGKEPESAIKYTDSANDDVISLTVSPVTEVIGDNSSVPISKQSSKSVSHDEDSSYIKQKQDEFENTLSKATEAMKAAHAVISEGGTKHSATIAAVSSILDEYDEDNLSEENEDSIQTSVSGYISAHNEKSANAAAIMLASGATQEMAADAVMSITSNGMRSDDSSKNIKKKPSEKYNALNGARTKSFSTSIGNDQKQDLNYQVALLAVASAAGVLETGGSISTAKIAASAILSGELASEKIGKKRQKALALAAVAAATAVAAITAGVSKGKCATAVTSILMSAEEENVEDSSLDDGPMSYTERSYNPSWHRVNNSYNSGRRRLNSNDRGSFSTDDSSSVDDDGISRLTHEFDHSSRRMRNSRGYQDDVSAITDNDHYLDGVQAANLMSDRRRRSIAESFTSDDGSFSESILSKASSYTTYTEGTRSSTATENPNIIDDTVNSILEEVNKYQVVRNGIEIVKTTSNELVTTLSTMSTDLKGSITSGFEQMMVKKQNYPQLENRVNNDVSREVILRSTKILPMRRQVKNQKYPQLENRVNNDVAQLTNPKILPTSRHFSDGPEDTPFYRGGIINKSFSLDAYMIKENISSLYNHDIPSILSDARSSDGSLTTAVSVHKNITESNKEINKSDRNQDMHADFVQHKEMVHRKGKVSGIRNYQEDHPPIPENISKQKNFNKLPPMPENSQLATNVRDNAILSVEHQEATSNNIAEAIRIVQATEYAIAQNSSIEIVESSSFISSVLDAAYSLVDEDDSTSQSDECDIMEGLEGESPYSSNQEYRERDVKPDSETRITKCKKNDTSREEKAACAGAVMLATGATTDDTTIAVLSMMSGKGQEESGKLSNKRSDDFKIEIVETAISAASQVLESGGNIATAQATAAAILSTHERKKYQGFFSHRKRKRAVANAIAAAATAASMIEAGYDHDQCIESVLVVLCIGDGVTKDVTNPNKKKVKKKSIVKSIKNVFKRLPKFLKKSSKLSSKIKESNQSNVTTYPQIEHAKSDQSYFSDGELDDDLELIMLNAGNVNSNVLKKAYVQERDEGIEIELDLLKPSGSDASSSRSLNSSTSNTTHSSIKDFGEVVSGLIKRVNTYVAQDNYLSRNKQINYSNTKNLGSRNDIREIS